MVPHDLLHSAIAVLFILIGMAGIFLTCRTWIGYMNFKGAATCFVMGLVLSFAGLDMLDKPIGLLWAITPAAFFLGFAWVILEMYLSARKAR